MPIRFAQNSFVSGVLSPELHGRIDLRSYAQGAAEIENFVVRGQGGVRKRTGTELLAAVSGGAGAAFRCLPFIYDRTTYAVLVLWRSAADSLLHYKLVRVSSGTAAAGSAATTSAVPVPTESALELLRFKQYGDTFIFTRAGMRAVRAVVNLNTLSVAFSQIPDGTSVATPPPISASVSGFGTTGDREEGDFNVYVPGTRRYALWGVRGGILSTTPRTTTVNITLAWKAGAKVTLSFAPDWTQADYYVLGKHLGANYGEVATFYPNTASGSILDATWAQQGVSQTGTVAGVEYQCAGSSAALLGTGNSETADGRDSSALFVTGALRATYKTPSAPILAMRVWFGGRVKNVATGAVTAVSNAGVVTVRLKTAAGTTIETWETSGGYSGSEQTFTVSNPAPGGTGVYAVEFESSAGAPVLVRGIAFGTSIGSCEYVDDNIAPGSITGIQSRLAVGDSGMDCALSEIWEQRLVLAGSGSAPFSLWFSQAGDLYNFYAHRPQVESDAFNVTIPPSSASKLLHLVAGRWLLAFTESGEYVIDSATSGGFSYATCSIRRCSSVGAHPGIPPVSDESNVLFVAADARSVYELHWDISQDGVVPVNRSLYAGSLTRTRRIVATAFARYPEPVLWCVLSDGTALSLTYLPDEEVFAWAHHSFGDGGMRLVDVLAPGSIDDRDGSESASDVVFVFTHPSAPGSLYVERARPMPSGDTPCECRDHMGYAAADFPAGADPARDVAAHLVTLRPETPDLNGMAQRKTILDCSLRLVRSGAVSVRPLGGSLADCADRRAPGAALYTGDVKVLPRSYQADDGQMVVSSADRNPCEILSVLFSLSIGEMEAGTQP